MKIRLEESTIKRRRYVETELTSKWTVSLNAYGAESSEYYDLEESFDGTLRQCIKKMDEYQDILENQMRHDGYILLEDYNGNYCFDGNKDRILSDLRNSGLI